MALPHERTMPVLYAEYHAMRRQWLVRLPGGQELAARDTVDLEALVRRHCPGTALRFDRTPRTA